MSYNPSIPTAGQFLSVSQPLMLNNFGQLNTIFGKDHVTFNATPNPGFHKQVTFASNNVPTIPTTLPVLFTNTNSVTGLSELFFYSGTSAQSSSQYSDGQNGSTFLFGGNIIKWGKATVASAANVSFVSPFPNNCWSVVLTGTDATKILAVTNITPSSFSFGVVASGTTTFTYIAIGN